MRKDDSKPPDEEFDDDESDLEKTTTDNALPESSKKPEDMNDHMSKDKAMSRQGTTSRPSPRSAASVTKSTHWVRP